ncbi:MAG: histidinol-phosphate transaminase [Chloroflexota bacterium]
MPLRPRPEVAGLTACPHGGPDYAELRAMGLSPEAVLDFSVSASPFPPPVAVGRVLANVDVARYPDPEATGLRQCLAARLGVAPDNIIAGNGAVELIRLIALTYFGGEDSILVLEPAFGEYRLAAQIMGAEVLSLRARAGDGFVPRLGEVVGAIREHRPRGVFIGQPASPTGQYLSRRAVETIRDALGEGLLVLDEAFIAFVSRAWPSLGLVSTGNVIVVRSMTKDYALAGLRLGYAVAAPEIIENLRRVRPPWHVNAAAQRAGVAALEDTGYLARCRRKVRRAKAYLVAGLGEAGLEVVPSRANFFLVRVGDGRGFRAALLERGILVRDAASFGLPEYVRIAPRTLPECRRLVAAVNDVMKERR